MRSNWEHYFLTLCKHIATRATCDRLHVGCVITINNRIIATGYNGSPSGEDHCDDVGHLMVENHCLRTVHAEANAVALAAAHGVSLNGSTCYLTHTPCWNCAMLLYTAGVQKVICDKTYINAENSKQLALFAKRQGLHYME